MNGKVYSQSDLDYLIEHYPNKRTDVIAKALHRTIYSVYGQAHKMKLVKSAEFLASPDSGILTKGTTLGKNTQFKKGHISANKGKKMSPELFEKCKHTMFKKGNLPGNTKEDGAITIRHYKGGNKYKRIRISLGKWVFLHRHVWEKENGKIPDGMIVKFKNGDSMNCDIENLYLCSRSQNMDSNTINRYSPEIKTAIRLIGKIQRYETNKP